MTSPVRALSGAAFATVLLVALLMGANHASARIAFNPGADVATGVPTPATDILLGLARLHARQRGLY